MMKIAVLVSGNGSNFQALVDANLSGQIVGLICNKANAYALKRAKQHHIPTCVIEHQAYPTRELFDAAMHQQLLAWQVDLVVLAGFMRILSAHFVNQWQGRMLNLHPSLLPAYKGMHTHQRVLHTGDRLHGCTVHFVTAELDAGLAIAQGVIEVSSKDTPTTLQNRVHQLEHLVYPEVVEWLCTKKLQYINANTLSFRNKPLTKPIRFCQ